MVMTNWHPIFVHFTVALSIASLLMFLLGSMRLRRNWIEPLLHAAHFNLWLAALFSIGTVTAGFYAFNTVTHDAQSHLAMLDHRNWAIAAAVVVAGTAIWSLLRWRRSSISPHLPMFLLLVCMTSLIGITGFKGGELVYQYGLGVLSLPDGEVDDNHRHGEEQQSHDLATFIEPETLSEVSVFDQDDDHAGHQHGSDGRDRQIMPITETHAMQDPTRGEQQSARAGDSTGPTDDHSGHVHSD